MNVWFPVEDQSRIGEIRRAADRIAREEGLEEDPRANIALVATEICTNLLKHARGGELFLSALSDRGEAGVEILSVDRGPGIADIGKCLADGYSSTNTSGTGLGAIARRSDEFDAYSELGKGTVLVARIYSKAPSAPTTAGAVLKPIHGEEVSGDAWAVSRNSDGISLVVADGLGHGLLAARASAEVTSAFRRTNARSPTALLESIHASARGTRGAAVAVACVSHASSSVSYAGIGNISGVLLGGPKPILMVSHNGTAGHHSPRLQEFSYPLPEQALIIMHSDGLHTNWNLDNYAGIRRRDPSLIAAVLYRDAARGRDDTCVAVVKIEHAKQSGL
jgi:anti-sigma regulatory factor (Ser/Thr protein kinase)